MNINEAKALLKYATAIKLSPKKLVEIRKQYNFTNGELLNFIHELFVRGWIWE